MTLDSKIILTYLSDSCSDEELEAVNRWIDECDENGKWLFDLKAMWDAKKTDDSRQQDYLDTQFACTWNKIKTTENIKLPFFRYNKLMKIIGYSVAACLIAFIVHFGLKRFGAKNGASVYITQAVSSSDSVRRIILPDKSVVWLNSNSEISYPQTFAEDKRTVFLSGEAYFEVVKDEKKPFRVQTSDFTVKVLGTKFGVSSYAQKEVSEAILVSGEVAIENNRHEKLLTLHPGQKIEYSKKTKEITVSETDADSEVAWKNKYISFQNATIKQIVDKLRYIYDEPIALNLRADDQLTKTYSGEIAREDSLELVFKNLQHVISFDFKKAGQGYIISTKM